MVNVSRRRALGLLGAGALATSPLPTSARGRAEGELPNDRVDSSEVLPFNCQERSFCDRSNPQEVPVGDWIVHTFAWVPGARDGDGGVCGGEDDQKRYLNNHLSNANWDVFIDGVEIANPDQYWEIVYSDELGQWILRWTYATPPKETRTTHTFTQEKTILNRHRVGWQPDSCEPRFVEPGDAVSPTTGKYVVVKTTG